MQTYNLILIPLLLHPWLHQYSFNQGRGLMDRRQFVTGGLATIAAGLTNNARAAIQQLGPYAWRAYVAHPQLVQQQCAQWCWAASTSMIFAHHNHAVA